MIFYFTRRLQRSSAKKLVIFVKISKWQSKNSGEKAQSKCNVVSAASPRPPRETF